MSKENFYLELLQKHNKELIDVIENKDKYSLNAYNCILAGIVIQMNAILEQTLFDFHSKHFSDIAKTIYNSRQLLVHYSDYRTFDNIEEISKEIIEKFSKVYQNEKNYFKNILSYKNVVNHNVVLPHNRKVIFDEFTNSYIFKSEEAEISISSDKITRIQDLKKRKTIAYIINCDTSMNYFHRDEEGNVIYHELKNDKELKNFFTNHFNVLHIDYNKHKQCVFDIINNFYKDGNYSAIYVQEKQQLNTRKTPLYLETSKVLDKFFNDNIVYSQFLDGMIFTNNGVPQYGFIDYKHIRDSSIEDLENNISKKDYFFIVKTISVFNNLTKEITLNSHIEDSLKNKLKITMLINWADHTFRYMSEEFVNANPDFKELYYKLTAYRNFFAHNILQIKTVTGERILEEFFDIAKGYVSILSSLKIKSITKPEQENNVEFLTIEKSISKFVNYKYEQYVQVDPNTYIGNKLFYSTRGSEYEKLIALIPIDKKYPNRGTYYEKRNEDFIAKTITTKKGGKKKNMLVTSFNCGDGEEVILDTNLDDLLYIYAAYKGKIEDVNPKDLTGTTYKHVIIFNPSEDNNNKAHAMELEEVISQYYQQKYLPYELVRETHLGARYDNDGKMYFVILNQDDIEIAKIVGINTLSNYNVDLDEKGFFTISETINDYSKRRIK